MRTVYHNTTKNLKSIRIWNTALIIIGFAGWFGLDVANLTGFHRSWISIIKMCCMVMFLTGIFISGYYLLELTVDEDEDMIHERHAETIRLSELVSITYKERRNGSLKSLFFKDSGVKYIDFKTNRETADRIVEQILKANPSVTVIHK